MFALSRRLRSLVSSHSDDLTRSDTPAQAALPIQFPPPDWNDETDIFQKGSAYEDIPMTPIDHAQHIRVSSDHIPPEPPHHIKFRQALNLAYTPALYSSDHIFSTPTVEGYDYAVQRDGSVPIRLGSHVPQQFFRGQRFYVAHSTPAVMIKHGTKIVCREGWGPEAPNASLERVAIRCVQRRAGTAAVQFGIRPAGEVDYNEHVVVEFEAVDVDLEPERKKLTMIMEWASCSCNNC